MESAITVDDLSKRYSLGASRTGGYRTLREAIVQGVSSPLNRLRGRGEKAGREPGIHWALKDVSFQVEPGEVVGVIGRNGAGKSTLLKVLSRITEPHSGRITLRGRVGSLLEVGVGFHQELTGRENIYLNGAIFGMSRREITRKFDAIVAFSEVEPFLDMPVKRYSSGMYVRLAFAVASHMEPEILLVDEVLAVGDAPFQKKCLGKMDEVSRSGRTVLFVSHNMATIINLCTKALVLERGRLIFDGDCDEGVAQYVSRCNTDCNSEVDLAEHPNRRTGSQPILGRLRLLDADGQPAHQFLCGSPMLIELEVNPNHRISRPHFAVGFEDMLGCRLFTLATYLTDTWPTGGTTAQRLVCRLEQLPLCPGRYSITLNSGPREWVWTDVIDQAVWFDVLESDFYGNGRIPNSDWGRVLVRSCWEPQHDTVLRARGSIL
jgi:lipopolysaccharide transport system ATP-binding protein